MKKYCVDLEIAKELKENGFPQSTEIVWCYYYDSNVRSGERIWGIMKYDKFDKINTQISAPISDEILKELPHQIKIPCKYDPSLDYLCDLTIYKNANDFEVGYSNVYSLALELSFKNYKLSNALARVWLYLKKEGYIK